MPLVHHLSAQGQLPETHNFEWNVRQRCASCATRVRVRLFGSSTDDTQKGGDIDVMMETLLQDSGLIVRAHNQFLARVQLAFGEQKIDVLIVHPDGHSQAPIYGVAKLGMWL